MIDFLASVKTLLNEYSAGTMPGNIEIKKLMGALKNNLSEHLLTETDIYGIIETLISIRHLIGPDLDVDSNLVEAAKSAFEASYYRIAYELLTLIKSNEFKKSDDYICLKSDILSIAGEFPEAAKELNTVLTERFSIRKALKYGELLFNNWPVDESECKSYINVCKNFLEKERAASPDVCYYLGRCYEKLFEYDLDDSLYNAANEHFDEYTINPNANDIKKMEAFWAMANMAKSKYYLALTNDKLTKNQLKVELKNYYEKAKDYYQKAKDSVNSYPIFEELMDRYGASFLDSIENKDSKEIAVSIMYSEDMQKIKKTYYHNDRLRKQFVNERHRLWDRAKNGDNTRAENYSTSPCLHILQRWNSYTPILKDSKAPSKGGGYYIDTGRKGIVIDPGFDFIQNFRDAGFYLNDIDYIFISHAHNDHSADLESLTTLLHDYNEKEIKGNKYSYEKPNTIYQQMLRKHPDKRESEINALVKKEYERSPRRKRFNIVLTQSTNRKFSFLDIQSSSDFTLTLINSVSAKTLFGESSRIQASDNNKISWYPIYAKHFDLISDAHCVGFIFTLRKTENGKNHESTALVYTGDTGFDKDIKKLYTKIKALNYKQTILLAHIGGFKKDEKYNLYGERQQDQEINGEAFYRYHLGRLGLARLAEILQPDLCIISEFGEEFRNLCRIDLAKLYTKKFKDHSRGKKTIFIPADIGLKVSLDMTIYTLTKVIKQEGFSPEMNWVKYREVDYYEGGEPEYRIFYGVEKMDKQKVIDSYQKLSGGKVGTPTI